MNAPTRPQRRIEPALLVVCILVTVLMAYHLGFAHDLTWDEGVYVAERRADLPSAGYAPTRSQGLLWLAAPIAAYAPEVAPIRIYLFAVHGLLLFVAFAPWIELLRWRTLAGPVVMITLWPVIYHAQVLLPNLSAALLLCGTLGLAHGASQDARAGRLLTLVAMGTLAAILRPAEVFMVLGLLALTFATRSRPVALALATAAVLGGLAWCAEAYSRFGGVAARMAETGTFVHEHDIRYSALWSHLQAFEKLQWFGAPHQQTMPWGTIGLWLGWLIAAAAGAWQLIQRPATRVTGAASLLTAASILAFYLVWVTLISPRFLLPAFALLAPLVLAAPSDALLRRWPVRLAIAALLYGLVSTSLEKATDAHAELAQPLRRIAIVGRQARAHTRELPSCAIGASSGLPQLVVHTGCRPLDLEIQSGILTPQPTDIAVFLAGQPRLLHERFDTWEDLPLEDAGPWQLRRRPDAVSAGEP